MLEYVCDFSITLARNYRGLPFLRAGSHLAFSVVIRFSVLQHSLDVPLFLFFILPLF